MRVRFFAWALAVVALCFGMVGISSAEKPVGEKQILVEMTVYEISKTQLERQALQWRPASIKADNSVITMPSADVAELQESLKIVREKFAGKIMCSPSLITISGRTAKLSIGGQIAYETINAKGNSEINFIDFGFSTDVKPQTRDDGSIDMDITSRIRQFDRAIGILENGQPAIREKSAHAKINVTAGESIVIAGLENDVEEIVHTKGYFWPYMRAGVSWLRTGDFAERRMDRREYLLLATPSVVDSLR
jgi:Flp pilus assembly secretin CpaC